MIGEFAHKFILLWGWRRMVAAFGFGLLAAAAMQPLLLWPVLFLSMPVLVWLIDGIAAEASGRASTAASGFATGWAFGFGYFLASLYWIGAAFLVEAHIFAWMMPLAVLAMAGGMAAYWGIAAAAASLLWRPGWPRIFLLATFLAAAEWLRGHLLSGFPWNSLGYAAEAFEGLSQGAALIGTSGLTFFVLLWTLAPARWAEPVRGGARLTGILLCVSARGIPVDRAGALGAKRLYGGGWLASLPCGVAVMGGPIYLRR
jgi:apolipoprotein N-acyltransferase